jgi:hypothetical protein
MDVSPSLCTSKAARADVGSGSPVCEVTDGQSIFKMLDHVMIQVEYHCFVDLRFNRIDPLYKELCLIIAEVLVLDSDSVIKIGGSFICARLVQEVYSKINNDHVRLVFSNFNNVSQRIFNKKAYLRTALYNAVFEIESHFVNDFRCD